MDDAGGGSRGERPRRSPTLIEAVERAYGLSLDDATDLGGSANLNLLTRGNGDAFVVRTYRHHVTDHRLGAIQAARVHLAGQGLPCALAVRAANGNPYIRAGSHLVEVEPFVEAETKMDSLGRIAAALPALGRVHDLLVDVDLDGDAACPQFANYVDAAGLVDATRVGTDRIRSWEPTAEEVALADAADQLAHAAAEAQNAIGDLPHQPVHGDFWDNNVLFRADELVLIGDFGFMGERPRVDDLALTLFFTMYLFDDALDDDAERELGALVDAYDTGSTRPLTAGERAALPVAVARQPLWSIAVWAAQLDDLSTARRHLAGHISAVRRGLAILGALPRYQDRIA